MELLCDFGCWAHPWLETELNFMKSDLMLQGLHLNYTFSGVIIDMLDILLWVICEAAWLELLKNVPVVLPIAGPASDYVYTCLLQLIHHYPLTVYVITFSMSFALLPGITAYLYGFVFTEAYALKIMLLLIKSDDPRVSVLEQRLIEFLLYILNG